MNEPKPIRWGVLGTARIATRFVAPAIRAAEGSQLAAIASRSAEKAQAWAAEHGAERSYGRYEQLLDDDQIDAVYIPLPPNLHAEWTIRAAERGKHVLCEKPLAMSTAEANEMAAACRQHGVQMMDGQMWVHHPRTAEIEAALRGGKLGTLRRVTSSFTWNWDEFQLQDLRMQRDLGGGALLDLGWYCVSISNWVFGSLPRRVYAEGTYDNDVDVNFSAILWYDDGKKASFDCAFNTVLRNWFEVAGTTGSLVCDDFARPRDVNKARYWLHDDAGNPTAHVAAPVVQEVVMIEDFCRAIRSGQLNDSWPQATVDTQTICDALDRSARSGAIVEL